MGAAAVVILRRQRDIVEVFEGARATSPATARDPDELGIDKTAIFNGLVRRAVLREAGEGRYYVDQPSWQALHYQRRRMVAIVFGILIVGLVLLLMAS